jgi:hypothetical protein
MIRATIEDDIEDIETIVVKGGEIRMDLNKGKPAKEIFK